MRTTWVHAFVKSLQLVNNREKRKYFVLSLRGDPWREVNRNQNRTGRHDVANDVIQVKLVVVLLAIIRKEAVDINRLGLSSVQAQKKNVMDLYPSLKANKFQLIRRFPGQSAEAGGQSVDQFPNFRIWTSNWNNKSFSAISNLDESCGHLLSKRMTSPTKVTDPRTVHQRGLFSS